MLLHSITQQHSIRLRIRMLLQIAGRAGACHHTHQSSSAVLPEAHAASARRPLRRWWSSVHSGSIPPCHRYSSLALASVSTAATASQVEEHLAQLNDEQREAVLTHQRAARVVAGPGSGKTRVVVARVRQLLAWGVPPSQIMVITFTNKAAGELKERLKDVLPLEQARQLTAGTFHSLCHRWLRQYIKALDPSPQGYSKDFIIYDEQDAQGALKNAMVSSWQGTTAKEADKAAKEGCGLISKAKNKLPTVFG
jgi:hypothetical protein